MDSNFIVYMTIFSVFAFCLIGFGLFAMGFFIGFRIEEKKLLRKRQQTAERSLDEDEKRTKNEWKQFMEYDGSTPTRKE